MAVLSVRRRACHYAFGASALAIAVFANTAVSAQCLPNPPVNGQTTKCDGEQTGGLVVALDNGTVEISDGAVLSSSTTAALLIARQSSATWTNTTNVIANGAIRGIGQYGIEFRTGAPNSSLGTSETLNLTIGAGGGITGTTGIAMTGSAANPYGYINLTLDNSGTISGTGGYAIQAAPNLEARLSVVNQESGVIGAISAVLLGLDNKGTIDGGQNSAIDSRISGIGPSATLQNSGTITSSGAAATITGISYNYTLINSGTISNTGTGMAIDGNSVLLTNNTGGIIRAGGDGVAIRTGDGALQLVNSGTIDGDVLIRTPTTYYVASSSVDSTGGTINGDLIFGGGSDTLHAVMKDGALFTGVTGTVNGGEGNDGIILDIGKDTTIATGISVAGFEYLNIKTGLDTTTTLADGFTATGPLSLTGSGTVINQTHLIANGYLGLQAGDAYGYGLKFTNLGTITGTANSEANVFRSAILLYDTVFDNSGTIDIIGDALTAGGGNGATFTNSGTITATNNTVYNWGAFTNSGTIRSTAGTALTMDISAYGDMKNSGTIDGAKVGVRLSGGTFLNSGLISSAGTAVAASGTLYNQAGGTIRGGTMAIGPSLGTTVVAGATVFNAGTIDGDVYLASGSSYTGYGNRFIALKGGILNGNLTLGQGDMLVTDLSSRTDSGFTGINGTVSANGAALRYRVTSDATATMGAVGGFGSVSYEVAEGTTLTLNAAATQTAGLTLAGHGTVDLDADFTLTDKPAITLVAPIQPPGESQVNSDLMVVSRGDISVRLQNPVTYPDYGAAVYLGNAGYLGTVAQFTNKGTISYQNASPATNGIAAIRGDGKVVNDGTILLDRAIAISGATEVINNGSIIEAPGGSASQGISATNITNTGLVRVSNQAISVDSSVTTIRNSGTLESLTTAAISGYSATVQNDGSGVIRGGGGAAIQLQGGLVTNSGTINGTVDLGYYPYGGRSPYTGAYVADGGTVQGDLLFGVGDDLFYAKGGVTGISGIIDGGAGRDVFAVGYVGAATAAVDSPITEASNFEDRLSIASGADTTLTLVADTTLASTINVGGDGWIVNRVSTTDMVSNYLALKFARAVPTMLAGFTNEADIGGVSIHARNFVNNGNIGGSSAYVYATDSLNFINSGTIVGTFLSGSNLSTLSATNEGTIDGGLAVGASFSFTAASPAVNIINKGTIGSTNSAAINIGVWNGGGKGAISIDNQGVVDGGVAGISVQDLNTYGNIFPIPVPVPAPSAITAISITNSGTIRTTSDGARLTGIDSQGNLISFVNPVITIQAPATTNLVVNNKAGGLIAAEGQASIAIVSNGALTLVNDGTIRGNDRIEAGTILAGAIVAGDADDHVRNNGTITGSIDLGNGNNRVENHGTIDGDVSFGAGDDSYAQSTGSILTGTVDGGAGFNTLVIDLDGSGAFTPPRYQNFQSLEQIGAGTVEYTEPVTFDSFTVSNGVFRVAQNNAINSLGTFTISGGRVVGALGSTMTATRFDVGRGATFGSAGAVNGDVNVQGILSPGASPGTMTINGTLSLASGSTTLFEMTPTISDAIIVNGKVVIENGATLTLTGSRPLTPGATYDLVTATGGISGRFTTIDKASTVLGLIVQTGDTIELLGQFMLPRGASPQATRVTDYLNGTLADASATPALLAATPSLLDGTGFANDTAMRHLSPEAYASATQIGVEQGLALVSASRTFAMAEGYGDAQPFTFGQMFGGWRNLPEQFSVGTARADISTHGLVGGIGYGSQRASVGAFIGWASASQHIRELGATTDADGVVAGVTGSARLGNLAVTALIARSGDNADTTRSLPSDGGKARGRYDLNSWVYDVHLSYDLSMSSDWTLSPELSVTRIATHRASVREKVDATPFGLSVNASKSNATFLGAALKLTGSPNRVLQPWLSGGFRSQLSGRAPTATAGFADISSGSMLAYGAGRSRALATIAGGLNIRVSRSAELLAHAGSEFGADSTGQEASLGLRMRF